MKKEEAYEHHLDSRTLQTRYSCKKYKNKNTRRSIRKKTSNTSTVHTVPQEGK